MQQEFRLLRADLQDRPCAGCGRPTGQVWAHLWSDERRAGYTEYRACSEGCAQALAAETNTRATRRSLSTLDVVTGALNVGVRA